MKKLPLNRYKYVGHIHMGAIVIEFEVPDKAYTAT